MTDREHRERLAMEWRANMRGRLQAVSSVLTQTAEVAREAPVAVVERVASDAVTLAIEEAVAAVLKAAQAVDHERRRAFGPVPAAVAGGSGG